MYTRLFLIYYKGTNLDIFCPRSAHRGRNASFLGNQIEVAGFLAQIVPREVALSKSTPRNNNSYISNWWCGSCPSEALVGSLCNRPLGLWYQQPRVSASQFGGWFVTLSWLSGFRSSPENRLERRKSLLSEFSETMTLETTDIASIPVVSRVFVFVFILYHVIYIYICVWRREWRLLTSGYRILLITMRSCNKTSNLPSAGQRTGEKSMGPSFYLKWSIWSAMLRTS